MPNIPSKKWGEMGVNMFESANAVMAFLRSKEKQKPESSEKYCYEKIVENVEAMLPKLVSEITRTKWPCPGTL